MTQEALQKLRKGIQRWPRNGYLSLLTANLEAKTGNMDAARRLYALAAAHSLKGTISLQVKMLNVQWSAGSIIACHFAWFCKVKLYLVVCP